VAVFPVVSVTKRHFHHVKVTSTVVSTFADKADASVGRARCICGTARSCSWAENKWRHRCSLQDVSNAISSALLYLPLYYSPLCWPLYFIRAMLRGV